MEDKKHTKKDVGALAGKDSCKSRKIMEK